MIAVLGILFGMVATAALVWLVGTRLPTDHVAASKIGLHQSPDAVFAVLVDVEAFPKWRDDVVKVDVTGERTWNEIGRRGAMAYERVTSEPPVRVVNRITDEKLPFGGTWTFTVAPTAEGCEVTIREEGVVRPPIFRVMSRYVFGHHAGQERWLKALATRFDEVATVTRVPV